jgi:hypothetical protein
MTVGRHIGIDGLRQFLCVYRWKAEFLVTAGVPCYAYNALHSTLPLSTVPIRMPTSLPITHFITFQRANLYGVTNPAYAYIHIYVPMEEERQKVTRATSVFGASLNTKQGGHLSRDSSRRGHDSVEQTRRKCRLQTVTFAEKAFGPKGRGLF